jgi:endonuclease G, mitochondrial
VGDWSTWNLLTRIGFARILPASTPSGSLDELIAEPTAGVESVAGTERGAAESVRKLVEGRPLDRDDRFQLEAIIIPDKRPAIDIVDGTYEVRHPLWRHLNEPAIRDRLRDVFRSVGRIELPNHPNLPYGGTGFVVGYGLLMTNRHVAEIFAAGLGARNLRFIPGCRAGIDFLRERDRTGSLYFDVRRVAMIHPYWDMALLQVEGLPAAQAPLRLSLREPEDLDRREVALVGYPAFDYRNPPDVQAKVFTNVYEVKRLQPGLVRETGQTESYGKQIVALTHDSSTLGGNSGSVVVHIDTGEVVALHFAGSYLVANYGVPSAELGRDGRVIDAGVHFSGMPVRRFGPADAAWRDADRSEQAGSVGSEPDSADTSSPMRSPSSVAGEETSIRFTIPIEVTIRVGAPAGPTGMGIVASEAGIERMVEPFRVLAKT